MSIQRHVYIYTWSSHSSTPSYMKAIINAHSGSTKWETVQLKSPWLWHHNFVVQTSYAMKLHSSTFPIHLTVCGLEHLWTHRSFSQRWGKTIWRNKFELLLDLIVREDGLPTMFLERSKLLSNMGKQEDQSIARDSRPGGQLLILMYETGSDLTELVWWRICDCTQKWP